MASKDPSVDAYIENAAEFARPILKHLRRLIHTACPEVQENIKWSFASFDYKGMLCSIAAFKQHCTFGFWKHSLLFGPEVSRHGTNDEAMGQFGRITKMSDLPADKVILGYVKKAMRLNEEGIKVPKPASKAKKAPLPIPVELGNAMKKNKKALAVFEKFSPSHQREYIEWITEAKREETRTKRVATAIEWMAEGKARHWKYMNC
jgi:uncharacterized protein YdeI (YjbR/CyaY-like superfamily)